MDCRTLMMLRTLAFLAVACSVSAFSMPSTHAPLLRSGRSMPSVLKMNLRSDTNKVANSALVAAVAMSTVFGFPAFDASASVVTEV